MPRTAIGSQSRLPASRVGKLFGRRRAYLCTVLQSALLATKLALFYSAVAAIPRLTTFILPPFLVVALAYFLLNAMDNTVHPAHRPLSPVHSHSNIRPGN
jgi:hypothetical protein